MLFRHNKHTCNWDQCNPSCLITVHFCTIIHPSDACADAILPTHWNTSVIYRICYSINRRYYCINKQFSVKIKLSDRRLRLCFWWDAVQWEYWPGTSLHNLASEWKFRIRFGSRGRRRGTERSNRRLSTVKCVKWQQRRTQRGATGPSHPRRKGHKANETMIEITRSFFSDFVLLITLRDQEWISVGNICISFEMTAAAHPNGGHGGLSPPKKGTRE